MIAQTPIFLALLGTALMAIVIFAPQVLATPAVVSFAPPLSELLPDRLPSPVAGAVAPVLEPSWPLLVDPRAGPCDLTHRLALVDALAAVGSPWAGAILAQAAGDETDPQVHDAIARARTGG